MEFHVTSGNELFDVLFNEVGSRDEDDIVHLAAETYYQSIPAEFGPRGGFVACPNGHSLTIMGEPGTSARDVIIDAHGLLYCLEIHDSSLDFCYSDVPWETIIDPAFDRPQIVISGITFQNGAYAYESGGLDIDASFFAVTVRNCIIKNNSTDCGRGGGLAVSTPFNLLIENNQILGNIVRPRWVHWGSEEDAPEGWECRGGGLFIWNAWNGYVIRNNIVADNVAEGDASQGGGMYLPLDGLACPSPYPLTGHLINNTICRNTARQGGGIHFTDVPLGTVNLYNNIIRSNTATSGDGSDDLCFAVPPDLSETRLPTFNLFNNNYSHALGTPAFSGANTDEDPRFVDPDREDFRLRSDSPMIGAGLNAVPDPPGLPESDFEGQARVNGVTVDIGADEYYWTPLPGAKMRARVCIGCNGRHGAVLVTPSAKVKLVLSLDANDDIRKPSKVFVVMSSASVRYFLSKSKWIPEKAVFYQGPLKNILPIDHPTPPPFKESGTYQFSVSVEFKEKPEPGSGMRRNVTVRLFDRVLCHAMGREGQPR